MAISLTAFEGSGKFLVPGSQTGEFKEVSLPAIIINVVSADPGQSFHLEIIDSKGKLAMKWKAKERLINLIVTTEESRVHKGDAFRTLPSNTDASASHPRLQ